MVELKVAPCSYEAAKYAVMHWHYSKAMPSGKLVRYGVWEDGRFIGAVLYGRGASYRLGKPYGLDQTEVCELVRVALTDHAASVSQVVAKSLRLLRASNPGLRLVVSFADPEYGHHGGIYQAGNWLYLGKSGSADEYIFRGRRVHGRSLRATLKSAGLHVGSMLERARRLDPNTRRIMGSSKHRYVMPLDRAMRRRLLPLTKPYPAPLAGEGSEASRPRSTGEGQVQSLRPARIGGAA